MSSNIFEKHFGYNLNNENLQAPKNNFNPFNDITLNNKENDNNYDCTTPFNFPHSSIMTENFIISTPDNFTESLTSITTHFDKEFEVLGKLGNGHFGDIRRCRNRLDGLEYAVKITKHKWKSERGKFETLQEVFALSSLSVCDDNPNIVKYFNGWVEDSKLYIVVSIL